MINYLLIVSRQGKARLSKWYATTTTQAKSRILKEVTQLVLSRKVRMCNVIEYKGRKVIYRRYASLFFVAEIGYTDNELITLEIIHRYVEVLDKYFGNVCELDIIFNFQQAYNLLDELVISGELVDTSKKAVLRMMEGADVTEKDDQLRSALTTGGIL
ncbi:AP complex, mu/sigma subunit [Ephemerocybe angulata]|uniref:AP complex subunit sigma n=1 Tax=Ephemerocybe angulata TaxID=980116 RepID=A0A8H6IKM5_9AGAR|nr:AP complex, mu/sigma subunit [Tulosesus angulatus]